MSDSYDKLLDSLIMQDLEECVLVIDASVSASAVRKALKTRLVTLKEQMEVLGIDMEYQNVSVSINKERKLLIKLSKNKNGGKGFSFTIIDAVPTGADTDP
jgi:hypothetical protein